MRTFRHLERCFLAFCILGSMAFAQQPVAPSWQEQARQYAEAKDWPSALQVVDREITNSPQDLDIRAWRARILLWSGKTADAEREYREILALQSSDPDNWLGLANVYLREGR